MAISALAARVRARTGHQLADLRLDAGKQLAQAGRSLASMAMSRPYSGSSECRAARTRESAASKERELCSELDAEAIAGPLARRTPRASCKAVCSEISRAVRVQAEMERARSAKSRVHPLIDPREQEIRRPLPGTRRGRAFVQPSTRALRERHLAPPSLAT